MTLAQILNMNSSDLLVILVWVVVPVVAGGMFILLPRYLDEPYQKRLAIASGVGVLIAPWVISSGVKWYYDQQVRSLCVKDGGIRVYEKISLPKERFNNWGQILIPDERNSINLKMNTDFFRETIHQDLKIGNPYLWRLHFKIFRKADRKLLGESVSYARIGGDLPGPWMESSFGCPKNADIIHLNEKVFVEIEDKP